MFDIKKDNRFSHISKDPRFRGMKREDRKVKIGGRFSGMFTNKAFKVKYTLDKRGRPLPGTSNDNLKKYYQVDSDESEEEEEEEQVEKPVEKPPKKDKGKSKKDKDKAAKKVQDKDLAKPMDKKNDLKNDKGQASKKKSDKKPKEESDERFQKFKGQSDESSEAEEDARFNMGDSLKMDERFELGEDSESELEDEEEEHQFGEEDEEENESENELPKSDRKFDPFGPDIARGEGVDSSEDEDDDSEEEEESDNDDTSSECSSLTDTEDITHRWGELHDDAVQVDDATHRLAVCNMDWDRIKANDLLMVLNSYKPTGGLIKSIKIYPSEYGLQRMKEENQTGPQELVQATTKLKKKKKIEKLEEGEEGSVYHREKLRVYQMNRLRYYYAVVECDSVKTADSIYKECDGMEYESSGTVFDIRFIPDDMTFDEHEPKSEVYDMPNVSLYNPTIFKNSAMQQSKVDLTWDETDPDRLKLTMRQFDNDDLQEMDLKDYLASDSEPEDGVDPYAGLEDPDLGPNEPLDEDQIIQELKNLVKSKDGDKKDEKDVDMEITWEPGLAEKVNQRKQKEEDEDLSVWDKRVQKMKMKKKEKKEARKNKKKGIEEESEEVAAAVADSEDDVPEGVDLNDPFFKEEMDRMDAEMKGEKKSNKKQDDAKPGKKKNKKKYKHEKLTPEEEEAKRLKEEELALIMMDEDDTHEHFSVRAIQEEEGEETMGKRKRKRMRKLKKKMNETEAAKKPVQPNFKMDTADPRFQALFDDPEYNIDTTSGAYVKTKEMEKLISGKVQYHQQKTEGESKRKRDADDAASNKKQKTDESEKKKDAHLESLIKSVKVKTQMLEKEKQEKKKKRKNDF